MRFIFFFQAEDGIRDLVRSRGLGDVYKRQMFILAACAGILLLAGNPHGGEHLKDLLVGQILWAVSYTHLTLPTSDLV